MSSLPLATWTYSLVGILSSIESILSLPVTDYGATLGLVIDPLAQLRGKDILLIPPPVSPH